MDKEEEEKLVTIFSGDANEALVAQSILDGAKIRYVTKNEMVQGIEGIGAIGPGYNVAFGPITFQVLEEDVKKAKELLKNFN